MDRERKRANAVSLNLTREEANRSISEWIQITKSTLIEETISVSSWGRETIHIVGGKTFGRMVTFSDLV